MQKNKLIYISLLLLCAALLIYAGHLLSSRADMSQPQRSVLFKQGEEYIVIFDITNSDPENSNYTISVIVDGKRYNETIFLGAGRIFTYKHHIYPPLQDKRVNVTIYKENVPVSANTYIIK